MSTLRFHLRLLMDLDEDDHSPTGNDVGIIQWVVERILDSYICSPEGYVDDITYEWSTLQFPSVVVVGGKIDTHNLEAKITAIEMKLEQYELRLDDHAYYLHLEAF